MARIIFGFVLSLMSVIAHAAVREDVAAVADLPAPDATGLVGFLVVMVVVIGGYVWHVARKERERKQRDNAKQ